MINRDNEILPQHCHGYVGGQVEWQCAKIRFDVANACGWPLIALLVAMHAGLAFGWWPLLALGVPAAALTVKLKFADFRQATRSRTLNVPVTSQSLLLETSIALVRQVYPLRIGIRLVGVTMSNFRDQLPVRQLNLTLSTSEASEPFSGRSTIKRPACDF